MDLKIQLVYQFTGLNTSHWIIIAIISAGVIVIYFYFWYSISKYPKKQMLCKILTGENQGYRFSIAYWHRGTIYQINSHKSMLGCINPLHLKKKKKKSISFLSLFCFFLLFFIFLYCYCYLYWSDKHFSWYHRGKKIYYKLTTFKVSHYHRQCCLVFTILNILFTMLTVIILRTILNSFMHWNTISFNFLSSFTLLYYTVSPNKSFILYCSP